ncbi:MAG: helicase HerA domain-containing protein [Thermoplasmata archaeon]
MDDEKNKIGLLFGDVGTSSLQITVTGMVEEGEFVKIFHENAGWVLGIIEDLERKTDLSVDRAMLLNAGVDVKIQEVLIGQINVIGYRDQNRILQRPKNPFKAGEPVYIADDGIIRETLGLGVKKDHSAYIGFLHNHEIPISLDINSLVQKHISILAKTGGGKSYFTGILVEELLKNDVTTVIIDPHGEYSSLSIPAEKSPAMEKFGVEPRSYKDKIILFSTMNRNNRENNSIKFTLSQFSPRDILMMIDYNDRVYFNMLRNAMERAKVKKRLFELSDVMNELQREEDSMSSAALINSLKGLDSLNLFSSEGTKISDIVKKGMASIINLKGVPPKIQEMLVSRLSYSLFELRKRDEIPPMILILEEAHNYIPQQGKSISSDILRTIASEGRKFGLGLGIISQRPAKVDKNVLSQCSTQVILKVTNPNDLKTIGESVEGLTRHSLEEIQRLPIGVALVTNPDLSFPLFVDIRPRETKHGGEGVNVTGN